MAVSACGGKSKTTSGRRRALKNRRRGIEGQQKQCKEGCGHQQFTNNCGEKR
jgi:hypothetical protein